MNLIFELSQINLNNIIFSDSKKNAIIDGSFTKIIYSDEYVSTNGLYINFPIQLVETNISKNIFKFNIHQYKNNEIIHLFALIESKLLELYKHFYNCNKQPIFILYDHLNNGNIKINTNELGISDNTENLNIFYQVLHKSIYIKISGIWETDNSFGITYKFIETK